PVWRIDLNDLSVDGDLRRAHRPHLLASDPPVMTARAQVVVGLSAVAVPLRPLALGDRVPHRLGLLLDVPPIDLRRCRRHHACSSSSALRSASADTWRSVYLSIHR